MAEGNVIIENGEAVADKFISMLKDKVASGMLALKDSTTQSVNIAIQAVDGLGGAFSKAGSYIKEAARALEDINLKEITAGYGDAAAAVDLYTKNLFNNLQVSKLFDSDAQSRLSHISDFTETLNAVGGGLFKYGEAIKKAEWGVAFEDQFTKAAASGGKLTDIFGKSGDETVQWGHDIQGKLAGFTNRILVDANIMGIGLTDALKQSMDLMKKFPLDLDHINEAFETTSGEVRKGIDDFTLLATVAKGTGRTMEETGNLAESTYKKWRSSAEGVAERQSLIFDVSQRLHTQFSNIQGIVDKADESFSMWGNNMEGVLDVLVKMDDQLSKSGFGIDKSIALVGKLADSVSNLSLSQKAFIGMQGGGLQGGAVNVGLQVEQMVQQGKFDEVAGMLEQAVTKQTRTSRVTTLQEAAENPELSSVFVTQRELLKQFTGTNDAMATRLMDVMSKTQFGGERQLDAGQAVKEAFSRGEDTQERQRNTLIEIANNTKELFTIAESLRAYNDLFGTGKLFGMEDRTNLASRDEARMELSRAGQEMHKEKTGAHTTMIETAMKSGSPDELFGGGWWKDKAVNLFKGQFSAAKDELLSHGGSSEFFRPYTAPLDEEKHEHQKKLDELRKNKNLSDEQKKQIKAEEEIISNIDYHKRQFVAPEMESRRQNILPGEESRTAHMGLLPNKGKESIAQKLEMILHTEPMNITVVTKPDTETFTKFVKKLIDERRGQDASGGVFGHTTD